MPRYLGKSSVYNIVRGKIIVENATFSIEAEDILQALKIHAETEADLLENRSDKEDLRIELVIEVERGE